MSSTHRARLLGHTHIEGMGIGSREIKEKVYICYLQSQSLARWKCLNMNAVSQWCDC